MVFEETLILNNIDDVQELTRTFRDAGIKVHISQTGEVEKEGVLIGKIQDSRALFTTFSNLPLPDAGRVIHPRGPALISGRAHITHTFIL